MDSELRDTCQNMTERILLLKDSLDYEGKQKQLVEINELMGAPGFWDNQEKAQKHVGELSRLKAILTPLEELVTGAEDLEVLLEFADVEETNETTKEIEQTVKRLEKTLNQVEFQTLLGQPEDSMNAYVTIQAGEGGTDAADWAEMLLRMYIRWSETHGHELEMLERTDGEEAGIRHATLLVKGDYAYGYLKGESGNHRLVRMSPFNSAGKRQTAFAAVDVTPEIEDNSEIEVDWDKDVKEDTMRAGGAGGQHVNKTESAVRLTHLETNLVVRCQNERSQHQNRAAARKMLLAKLYQLQLEQHEAEVASKRGEKSKIGFGGETIRNYVLQPEQFVKDTRSELKTTNPLTVLEGELDPFLEAYLQWAVGKKTD
ncbi:peptide chain release factor 2 [uncultured Rubinisphaera sp.]|uniref:peptide chain release factor 2 n=1 Tax=uncultured Rubinisphaera sp. TaxID=1678686 RepID=UPI0030DAE1D3